MKVYGHYIDGVITIEPLPFSIVNGEQEIIGFNLFSDEELANYNYYPVVEAERPDINQFDVLSNSYDFQDGQIVESLEIIALSEDEMVSRKARGLKLSMVQFRLMLRKAALFTTVNAYLQTLTEVEQDIFEYSTEVYRNNSLIAAFAIHANMSERQVDDFFIAASKIIIS